MRSTRKKVIKTVYKEDNSDEEEGGDFSDSGSEAQISGASSSEEEEIESEPSSADEFDKKSKNKRLTRKLPPNKQTKEKFAKSLIKKIDKQTLQGIEDESPAPFSIKNLTEGDKLLPPILNLSESDSSDDETPNVSKKSNINLSQISEKSNDSDNEVKTEYKDVWSTNKQEQDESEEIAKRTFMELEQHKSKVEETKATLHNYTLKIQEQESDVKDLLALGEEVLPTPDISAVKKPKFKRRKDDSDSEIEDWEEVKETKTTIPQQGIQLFVEFPDAAARKSKKVDVEMMMKRKINRVKKEYQVYMHKVHVLCWLGHGNYISRVLNDQELMAAALALVPSKECYPGERVDMKYVEQITIWYKDKLTLKQDKNEDKFKPKAPPLKTILMEQIKKRTVTSNKNLVFIFVAMLRVLGLQCRIMFNFVTLPLKPPASELCSLSTKPKDEKAASDKTKASKSPLNKTNSTTNKKESKEEPKASTSKAKPKKQKIAQLDGIFDSSSSDEEMQLDHPGPNYFYENIMQVDGNDDTATSRKTRTSKRPRTDKSSQLEEDVSPPKVVRKSPMRNSKPPTKSAINKEEKITQNGRKKVETKDKGDANDINSQPNMSNVEKEIEEDVSPPKIIKKSPHGNSPKPPTKSTVNIESKSRGRKKVDIKDKGDVNAINLQPNMSNVEKEIEEDVSAPKIIKKSPRGNSPKPPTKSTVNIDSKTRGRKKVDTKEKGDVNVNDSQATISSVKNPPRNSARRQKAKVENSNIESEDKESRQKQDNTKTVEDIKNNIPKISITDENKKEVASKYFEETKPNEKFSRLSRKRSQTTTPSTSKSTNNKVDENETVTKAKGRTKSAPGTAVEQSKYFKAEKAKQNTSKKPVRKIKEELAEDKQRVSHRDLVSGSKKPKLDVTGDLVDIIKSRIKDAKFEAKKKLVKGKTNRESDEDSDFLPVEDPKAANSDSDIDFKPTKISPKPSTSRRIDRRVLSSSVDEPIKKKSVDVWCEIFVEELEQWISVDVVKGKIHSTGDLYSNATHPVCYIVGWDNNNYIKDLTRKYVPQYNTVTRKLRAEQSWWEKAVRPFLGPKTARDREEDEYLDRMQLDAPLPKSIAEYKNHPLYALKRHLLKFEAIYPPDAAVLGFVRGEPVYARDCVYTCYSRDTWLKEAKVVKVGEKPYKTVKARPKWDKLNNKIITDTGTLEVFGPWQTQDYEPPVAENGLVPRNAYGNVELFKECMLPKGTVHIKLAGLNRVARKLNIDCAPAMTGFDFNGGFCHPVYDGFVVCQEFEEIITDAWVKDQEEQERKEREKIELRVYGNWKRLIKGLLIRERLKNKYGFEEPTVASSSKGKSKGPRLVVKKK